MASKASTRVLQIFSPDVVDCNPIFRLKLIVGPTLIFQIYVIMLANRIRSGYLFCRMMSTAKFLKIDETRNLAYRKTDARNNALPGVIFVPGYMSVMNGIKALALEEECKRKGMAYVRFDYEGIGESGGDWRKGRLGLWLENALLVMDNLTKGPQIVVGCSLGGWIAILVAMSRPQRIHGVLTISAAVNFPITVDLKNWNIVDIDKVETLFEEGSDRVTLSHQLLEESKKHFIDTSAPIEINCPFRLLHGIKDDLVSYKNSLLLANRLTSNDVEVIVRREGNHRMSEPRDLQLLIIALNSLIQS